MTQCTQLVRLVRGEAAASEAELADGALVADELRHALEEAHVASDRHVDLLRSASSKVHCSLLCVLQCSRLSDSQEFA